jgi:hypothetical protein
MVVDVATNAELDAWGGATRYPTGTASPPGMRVGQTRYR